MATPTFLGQTLDIVKTIHPAQVAHIVSKQQSRRYFQAFLENYLAHHFNAAWGEHHIDLINSIQDKKNNKRVARCEPREFGKSTLVLVGAPAWWMATKQKWYMPLFGASAGAISKHYATLQSEFEPDTGNQKLLRDFPHLEPAKDFKNQYISWNDSVSVIRSGAVFEALSSHGRVRGMKQGKRRPDVMMFDDPQDDESVATEYLRNKFLHRFRITLMNLLARGGDIYVIGNLLHSDSLVGTLLRDSVWDGKLYRAENVELDERDKQWPIGNTKTDGSALWPDHWPMDRLRTKREEIKSRAYSIEFMNRESSDEEKVYDSSEFLKFSMADFELDSSYYVLAYWDPSNPKEKRFEEADYASITVVAAKKITLDPKKGPQPYFWVLHNWLHQARPEIQVVEALRCLKAYPIRKLIYEDNGGFGMIEPYLRKEAKDQNIALPLKMFSQTKNKVQRIYNVEPIVKRRVFFADHLSTTYFNQWDDFPHGAHDDGPDSTVAAIEAYKYSTSGFVI